MDRRLLLWLLWKRNYFFPDMRIKHAFTYKGRLSLLSRTTSPLSLLLCFLKSLFARKKSLITFNSCLHEKSSCPYLKRSFSVWERKSTWNKTRLFYSFFLKWVRKKPPHYYFNEDSSRNLFYFKWWDKGWPNIHGCSSLQTVNIANLMYCSDRFSWFQLKYIDGLNIELKFVLTISISNNSSDLTALHAYTY